MTQPGDELLVAYTDGELTTTQRDALARVLENDPVASQRIKSLKGAHQRLHIAFDQMLADYSALADLENSGRTGRENTGSTTGRTEESPVVVTASREELTSGQQAFQPREKVPPHSAPPASDSAVQVRAETPKRAGASVWIVLLLLALLSAIMAGLGWANGWFAFSLPSSSPKKTLPVLTKTENFAPVVDGDWKLAVLHHHTLAILKKMPASQNNADLESARIFVQYSLKLKDFNVPDLKPHGLAFAGAKILMHAKERIARLVYMGENERVVSLYVKVEKGSEAIERQQLGEINAVHWSQNGTGYVVAGREPYWSLIVLAVEVKRQNGGAN